MPVKNRCPLACPHGDQCVLEAGHAGGCNHRECGCNEPNAPRDDRARVPTKQAIEQKLRFLLGATRLLRHASSTEYSKAFMDGKIAGVESALAIVRNTDQEVEEP